mmetsp:Transcript_5206/g.6157  ORF Transcript_5206/g.6157 Transcript_5206/m.6157 type:complete len:230 (+) Transcript_5206:49-738(+)
MTILFEQNKLMNIYYYDASVPGKTNANLRKNVYPPVNPTNPEALLNPSLATETAPETFTVEFQVSRRGLFRANCHREWAPKGADRFYNLVRIGFYDDTYIFRSIRNFMMQFGISSDPQVANAWKSASITDDKNAGISNKKGYLTFAHAGPNTRTTQIFINFKDNAFLDRQSFTPLCQVTDMHTPLRVRITGEGAPQGPGPSQEQLQRLGGTYIKERYPDIDRIISARLL